MLDLQRYLQRIKYSGPSDVSLKTLNGLIRAHVEHIPFENLDVFLGLPVEVTPEAIENKILERGRGGYCFEQNGLFANALEALGFAVTRLSARVRIERPRDMIPPQTHLFLRVELEGQSYLADVGVGALSPTCALKLQLEETQRTPHESRRILAQGHWKGFESRAPGASLFHQAFFGDAWHDVCEFTLEPIASIDCVLANWFTSAHPQSHFLSRLMVARTSGDSRLTLLNRELKQRGPSGESRSKFAETPQQLVAMLREHFGITSPANALSKFEERLWD